MHTSTHQPQSAARRLVENGLLDTLLRSRPGEVTVLDDARASAVLQVVLLWDDAVVDVQHTRAGHAPLRAGSTTGLRWRFMGIPVAWVPRTFARLGWCLAPLLSEVSDEARCGLFVPSELLPEPSFSLVVNDEGVSAVRVPPSWSVEVDGDGKTWTVEALCAAGHAAWEADGVLRVVPTAAMRVVLGRGSATVVVWAVPAAPPVPVDWRSRIDPASGGIVGAALAAFLLAITVAWTSPVQADMVVVDEPHDGVRLVFAPPPVPVPVEAPKEAAAGPSAPARGVAGKRPGETAKRASEGAARPGLLGALDDSALAGVLGQASLNADFLGGIGSMVASNGVDLGAGGIGARGGRLGDGGGHADGVPGGAGGRDRRAGPGDGGIDPLGKGTGRLQRADSDPIILGALDKALVDAVIQRQRNQIRYCYQKALVRDPDLGGKVTVRFAIGADGKVSTATIRGSTLGAPEVESCITERFLRFQFPSPKGGGVVLVTYPFVFSPG